jgi:uncharacterized lipoprotein YmbA
MPYKPSLSIGILIGALSMGGCSVRYPKHYVLDVPLAVHPTDASSTFRGHVSVREFASPAFLRTGAIVYRQSAEKLDFYDFHRWAEDPRLTVTQAMVNEMRSRKSFPSVSIFDGRNLAEWIVAGRLNHLEEVDEAGSVSVQVEIMARLINSRTGLEIWQGTASKKTKLIQHTVPGVVTEMSNGVSGAIQELVTSMVDTLSQLRTRQ